MQKNGFVIKICVLTDIKKKRILFTQMYYKADKNQGSIFFQAVFDDAILHVAFLYSWADRKNGYLISCSRNGKDNVWEK